MRDWRSPDIARLAFALGCIFAWALVAALMVGCRGVDGSLGVPDYERSPIKGVSCLLLGVMMMGYGYWNMYFHPHSVRRCFGGLAVLLAGFPLFGYGITLLDSWSFHIPLTFTFFDGGAP